MNVGKWREQGYGVALFEYPGYGKSTGNPSEEGFYEALESVSDHLNAKGIPISSQIAVGWSIGGAVTTHVAAERQFKGVILASTFPSFPQIVHDIRDSRNLPDWWFPGDEKKLIQRFNSIASIPKIQSKVAVLHGEKDNLFPIAYGEALLDQVKHPIQSSCLIVPKAGHRDIASPEYAFAINQAIQQF